MKGISVANTTLDKTGELKQSNEQCLKAIGEVSTEFVAEPAFVDRAPIDAVHYIDRTKL